MEEKYKYMCVSCGNIMVRMSGPDECLGYFCPECGGISMPSGYIGELSDIPEDEEQPNDGDKKMDYDEKRKELILENMRLKNLLLEQELEKGEDSHGVPDEHENNTLWSGVPWEYVWDCINTETALKGRIRYLEAENKRLNKRVEGSSGNDDVCDHRWCLVRDVITEYQGIKRRYIACSKCGETRPVTLDNSWDSEG